MRECESRDLAGLLARMTKSNTTKSAPKFDIIIAYSSFAIEMAKSAPNMIIGYLRLKYAVDGLHNEEACMFGKRSYNKELISINKYVYIYYIYIYIYTYPCICIEFANR